MKDVTGLADLLSADVAVVETRDAVLDDSLLWPAERDAIGDVVAGRRWDWTMGRRCARQALDALGVTPEPVLSGPRREPLWPDGVVGAITHTHGYAAAAVARAATHRGVGVDAEADEALPDGVLARIAGDREATWLATRPEVGVGHPDRLLFSVKESIYKVWFPLARRWLGFHDVEVTFDADRQTFVVEIGPDGPVSTLEGRYASIDGVILSAIELRP